MQNNLDNLNLIKSTREFKEKSEIILIAGATGESGVKIVEYLISQNIKVRILVRNLDKAKSVFFNIWEKLDGIYECDLANEFTYKEALRDAFQETKNCKVTKVISCLAGTTKEDEKIMHIANYKININLINYCKKEEIEKFIFISSAQITKPYSFISLFINQVRPDALGLKNLVEIFLRKSGLNYIIIRPCKLEDKPILHEVNTGQGDNIVGFITRTTLAKVIFDSMKAGINNCTFEVSGEYSQMDKSYINPFQGENLAKLKPDIPSDNIVYNHLGCLNLRKKIEFPLGLIAGGVALRAFTFVLSRILRVKTNKIFNYK